MNDKVGIVPALLFTSFVTYLLWRFLTKPREKPCLRSVAILVLGDIGRSPRMMYHAESFAKIEFETYLIGYKGSKPVPSLLSLPHVHFLHLSGPPAHLQRLPFILLAPFKILHQIWTILSALLWRIPHSPEFIMVQYLGSKVIIDWHNLGYSILALRLGPSHIFVRIAKAFEAYFGRSAYAHLFVTRAMRDFLVSEWHIQGIKVVLHDRPPAHFHRATPSETHELFLRLTPDLPSSFLPRNTPPYSTCLTRISNSPFTSSSRPQPQNHLNMPSMRSDRPAVVVSSTSWTEDEDFGILIDALGKYERRAREVNRAGIEARSGEEETERGASLPKLLMIVTGKGPLKQKYMRKVQKLQDGTNEDEGKPWEWVRCVSLWLEVDDYPVLLGSADLGVSLHSSSSALDLPMKVVDMFGCGLPVCALDFAWSVPYLVSRFFHFPLNLISTLPRFFFISLFIVGVGVGVGPG
ncbi:hypothetical protein EW146_g487 [Bondarzewia mesenterica]|uniref:Chitobiosyldiphosphodolichol beta-mannosyltransferase n=1 Tax=Bondarzewia mesenterica TaxID=1095465 RepID=A0A4S4M8U1_9AGAM|nr:hypothetical protein EW146_g487 [Bondarzewia mesenterica]